MYVTRAAWIYSYFSVKEKIHKQQIMKDELKITSTKATCWHRHTSCLYLTCILYQRTVITQIFSAF